MKEKKQKEKKEKAVLPKEVSDYFREIGRRGGSSTSEAKKKASAENGRLYGGRPKGSLGKKKREAADEKIGE